MKRAQFRPGDRVQALVHWMSGAPPHWFGGWRVVTDDGARVVLREAARTRELRVARWMVRRAVGVRP